jgi:superfamily II DNA or RNA helicase
MTLSDKLADFFDTTVWHRGKRYFLQGRVRIQQGSECTVKAWVQGSQKYEVSLDWEDNVLTARCDCPYVGSDGPCKHLWATILAADAYHYLSAVRSARRLSFDCMGDEFTLESRGNGEQVSRLEPPRRPSPPPVWKKHFTSVADLRSQMSQPSEAWPARREILYVVEVPGSAMAGCLVLSLASHDHKANGDWTSPKPLALKFSQIAHLPLPDDREIVSALGGGTQYYQGYGYGGYPYLQIPSCYQVTHPLAGSVVARAARAGRCYLRKSRMPDDLAPLSWDDAGAWQFRLEMRRRKRDEWTVTGILYRSEERMELATPVLFVPGGLVFTQTQVAPLAEDAPFEWIVHLRKEGSIKAADAEKHELLAALLASPAGPAVDVPEELSYEEVRIQPRPCLRIRAPDPPARGGDRLRADLSFDYEGLVIGHLDPASGVYQAAQRRFLRRDLTAEKAAAGLLNEVGARFQRANYWDQQPAWDMAPSKLPRVVRTLLEAGWHVEAKGKIFRRPGAFHIEVATGVDWFELRGKVEYGETAVRLPQLLEALRRGDNMVQLDDGTYGMLPEEWLRRIGMLAGMGTPESDHLRFRPSQAGLLDALLASQPEAGCDETFARVREEIRQFEGIEAAAQPDGFVGRLRDYQRQGLGWIEFLRRFSFGGCLADDMGVGKTAQVLALFETRRELRAAGESLPPSLVVVPRSLVFNWKQEAARFTPQLRLLDYTGIGRASADFATCDVVLTTYGTLRRDALHLKDVEFDYVVLDEAQAVKNAETDAANAVRLLHGRHRLALSGTPVENHLGELWSLFEFLNPGMLGAASVFKKVGGAARNPGEDARRLLAQALRPFFLRRTKEQVAPELPPKTEQTVYCEMKPVQRKLYDELREYYRATLLKRVEAEGLAKSKIQVLEALLRLRQAACHPGLIDAKRSGESSAKLETLMAQLREVLDAGHKALVFSQFTSLLRIVRDRLDGEGVAYEYLDGATRDRQAPVERFQKERGCRLFLISLKAGGLGLNLTAAEYVFLLDPWWNPAVEAQAIDRAHRIGQTRQIFAYRLIARDTVEEKVLELQKSKRDLAAAIISADNSLIRDLQREDLELLLS